MAQKRIYAVFQQRTPHGYGWNAVVAEGDWQDRVPEYMLPMGLMSVFATTKREAIEIGKRKWEVERKSLEA